MVEHCCSVTFLQTGETMHSVAKDMDIHSYRVPLGVTAGYIRSISFKKFFVTQIFFI